MLEPDDVSAILRFNELGRGSKRIARELGISRNTVKDYVAAGGAHTFCISFPASLLLCLRSRTIMGLSRKATIQHRLYVALSIQQHQFTHLVHGKTTSI